MTMRAGTRLAGIAFALTGAVALSRPAAAQDYERILAGIRLNSKANTVLARYGNPNEVVIGDVGVRGAGPNAGGTGAGGGSGEDGGGFSGSSGYPGAGASGGFGGGRGPRGMGASGMGGSASPGGFGSPGGGPAPDGGGGLGAPGGGPPGYGSSGYPGGSGSPYGGGYPGGSGYPGAGGGGGGGGAFGPTVSPLARQQEVTWIYNRKVNNNLVSYEFLIGPNGNVSQIRVSGYGGGNSRTKRGISLGSTYKDVVRIYGYPEEHVTVGRVLVASYRKTAHVQFQFMNERGQANPMSSGNKCVAVTIATVE